MHPLQQHIEEIISLTDEEFEYIFGHFHSIKKRKLQYIVQEGEMVSREFWVIKGGLKSYFFDHNGKEHIQHPSLLY